jgi:hypothetical protein
LGEATKIEIVVIKEFGRRWISLFKSATYQDLG